MDQIWDSVLKLRGGYQKSREQDKEKQSHIRNIVVKLWNTKLKEKKKKDSWRSFHNMYNYIIITLKKTVLEMYMVWVKRLNVYYFL